MCILNTRKEIGLSLKYGSYWEQKEISKISFKKSNSELMQSFPKYRYFEGYLGYIFQ